MIHKTLSLSVVMAVLAGCTSVDATLPDGSHINVVTFATSRQDIDIAHADTHWKASDSSPDKALTQAILNLTALLTVPAKVP